MPRALSKDTAGVVGRDARVVVNRSLFADKYAEFPDDPADKTAQSRTIQRLVGGGFNDGPAVPPRRAALAAAGVAFSAKLGARMIVNHAGGVIENAGLALDRHSGIPFIPGSALKGIAREGAHACGATPQEIALIFGWAPNRNQEADLPRDLPAEAFGGAVAFLPAYPTGSVRIERDVVTVHHREYYTGKRPVATDDEQPVPNEFPVVAAGAEFAFVIAPLAAGRAEVMRERLGLPPFNLLAKAKEWLIAGLTQHGIGAKTAAGYGWFEYDAEAEKRREEQARRKAEQDEAERRRAEQEARRLAALLPVDREKEKISKLGQEEFAHFAKALDQKTLDEQKAFILLLKSSKKDWWKTKRKKDAALAGRIRKVAQDLGENLP